LQSTRVVRLVMTDAAAPKGAWLINEDITDVENSIPKVGWSGVLRIDIFVYLR